MTNLQARQQVDELVVISQAASWRHAHTAPLLTELSVTLATLTAGHEAALEALVSETALERAAAAAATATATAAAAATATTTAIATAAAASAPPHEPARKPHFLAQLVPAMRHHDAPRFGRLLHAARATMGEHRAARERICAELQLIRSGPEEDSFVSAAAVGGGGGGGEGEAASGAQRKAPRGGGGLVRSLSRGFGSMKGMATRHTKPEKRDTGSVSV
jgi:hypothetical protein